jgi:hypothetical protein
MLQVFQRHVASDYSKCFICFRRMLQTFFIRMLQMFRTCCKSMFQMFQLFYSYVAVSVFMLQLASVLSGCCICFTHMLQEYVSNVSSALDLHCIQVFHDASVSCFIDMFRESCGHGLDAGGRGAASQGPTDGVRLESFG